MNIFKRLFTPTPLAIINDELAVARLQLLSAENDEEHVQAQVNLLNARIARLEGKLKAAAAYSSARDAQFYPGSSLVESTAATHAEFSHATETATAEIRRNGTAMMEEIAKSALAGSDQAFH
ncbi:hypothetical protein [Collimonas silvisoli]|uniref:hypothetical protein n=1 Tax=Collimonas silvisoli TaxID=2825884 RepID=UPI001B8CE393|nr:hypothetical protein [Collimonas silvisoli]